MSRLIRFYMAEDPDHRDRFIHDIWALDEFGWNTLTITFSGSSLFLNTVVSTILLRSCRSRTSKSFGDLTNCKGARELLST